MRAPRVLLKHCAGLLQSSPDMQLCAGEALDIPLRTLPLARLLCAGAGASMLACVTQLLVWRQGLLGAVLLAVSAALVMSLRRELWLRGPGGPVRLQLTCEGQFRVYCRDGRVEPARLRPQSMRVGGGVLLVLGGSRTYRLWLARGNVRPEVLAGLHRRLGRGSAGVPGLR
jgi:hypothetical protein